MYSDIAANKRKTVYHHAGLYRLRGLIVWMFDQYLGGSTGVFYGGLIGAAVYAVITYYAGCQDGLGRQRRQGNSEVR